MHHHAMISIRISAQCQLKVSTGTSIGIGISILYALNESPDARVAWHISHVQGDFNLLHLFT